VGYARRAPPAPPPATPSAVIRRRFPRIRPGLINVIGQQVAGSGFFDPGSGYAKRLDASIPGVTINNIVYNGPTSVTLDVSTLGASTGSRNVTIVNPDGQSATGIGLLTIGAPGGQGASVTTLASSSTRPAPSGRDLHGRSPRSRRPPARRPAP
jgi:hypothetical protein